MKKKDLLYICVLVAVSCFLFSCGEKKKQLTPKEEFLMGLTAEDTVQVLTISRSCMDTLKAGNIDEALKMLFILRDGKAIPLPAEKEQQLRKKFKYFPVVDYKLDYYSFSSTDNNDVKFQIEFFKHTSSDDPRIPRPKHRGNNGRNTDLLHIFHHIYPASGKYARH